MFLHLTHSQLALPLTLAPSQLAFLDGRFAQIVPAATADDAAMCGGLSSKLDVVLSGDAPFLVTEPRRPLRSWLPRI